MEQPGSVFSFLLVLIAIGLAWLAGYRSRFHHFPGLKRSPQQDYFVGLNYLLNDEPDDAIDIFIESLEVNSATLATHLALGTLLRRRGKVDRSITHYQQMLDHGSFSGREQAEIKIQLVRMFIAAGLLDRAERLLEEVMLSTPTLREVALGLAITVFQKEKEWQRALDAATELQKICPSHRKQEIQLQASHYFCELAEAALDAGETETARDELKKATQICRHNVRIYLMLGRLETLAGAPTEAVRALLKVGQFDPAFAGEAAERLRSNLDEAGIDRQPGLLAEEAVAVNDESRQVLERVAIIARLQGADEALNFLLPELQAKPSLSLLTQSISLAAKRDPATQTKVLELSATLLSRHLLNSPHYRCENCGFELKSLHWLCPGCSRWGMVKPLDDLINFVHEDSPSLR
jgi:lipopolysaccharide assembly protein B